jgi:hypothetical protein
MFAASDWSLPTESALRSRLGFGLGGGGGARVAVKAGTEREATLGMRWAASWAAVGGGGFERAMGGGSGCEHGLNI